MKMLLYLFSLYQYLRLAKQVFPFFLSFLSISFKFFILFFLLILYMHINVNLILQDFYGGSRENSKKKTKKHLSVLF